MRTLSMALAVYGLADLRSGVALLLSVLLSRTPCPACTYTPLQYLLAGPVYLIAGLLLVRAKWPISFAYGPE